MALSSIKLIQRKNTVSSSNNCNKIFELLKLRNFRDPDKSGTKVKTHFLLTHSRQNQQCVHGKDNRPGFLGRKIVIIAKEKLLSVIISLATDQVAQIQNF